MKKIISLVLAMIMLLSMTTSAFADGINGPMQKAVLTVGVNAEFFPFEYYEGEELKGFDIDLMKYIGGKIGFDIEFVDMPFDKLIPSVVSGEVDCVISCITITKERESVIDYTIPYLVGQTELDGKLHLEQYAIVFPNNFAQKAELVQATGQDFILTLVNDAIKEFIDDSTVNKLIKKYGLNSTNGEDGYSYSVASVVQDDVEDVTVSENSSDGTPLAPPSDWAVESVEKAKSLKITNDDTIYRYRMSITREEFCELIYNYCYNVVKEVGIATGENPFIDTSNSNVIRLNKMGIINGKSATEFAPNDFLTREEAATILFRMIDKVHPDWAAHQVYYMFDDEDNISDWAMNSIQTICNMGIMQGVGNNKFAPQDTFTTEQAIATIVRVNNGFNQENGTLTFADKLNQNMPADKNYMFSPLSIKMALLMAANGATGETQEEILKATDVKDLNVYNESVKQMLDKYRESDILKLNVSNSIWINSDKTPQRFSNEYKEALAKTFDATSDVVTNENAVGKINGWVNEKTEGKIPTIINEENKDFWAMLVNAVYFKGRWLKEFSKEATKKDIFISKDGTETETDFMRRIGWMPYANIDGVSVVSLPYLTREDIFDENGEYVETKKLEGVNVSMYLMMSDDESFSPEEILNKTEMGSAYIDLYVPKFNIEYSTGLNDILKSIGINKAFRSDAEFEKMFDNGNMWIDSSIHKTYIKVDEEGTEAAAVTALGMAGSALPPEPIELKFNKPFTFIIKDDANGEILFMGKYAFASEILV